MATYPKFVAGYHTHTLYRQDCIYGVLFSAKLHLETANLTKF